MFASHASDWLAIVPTFAIAASKLAKLRTLRPIAAVVAAPNAVNACPTVRISPSSART